MEIKRIKCSVCGAPLNEPSNGFYTCPFCKSSFREDATLEMIEKLQARFDFDKMEKLAFARCNLYRATHEKYLSSENIKRYIQEVKLLYPEDVLANFYECFFKDRDSLNDYLLSFDLQKNRTYLKTIVDFTIQNLNYSSVTALKNLVEKGFEDQEELAYNSKIEEEAQKLNAGVYSLDLDRDVFVCYSSKDIKSAVAITNYLEQQGLTCFIALRNLRHGIGALENYKDSIKKAMRHCKCVVFLSSRNSRRIDCDTFSFELPYLKDELPKTKRIEYLIEEYHEGEDFAKEFSKQTFDGLEWCKSLPDLAKRLTENLFFKSKETSNPEINKEKQEYKYCVSCLAKNSIEANFCVSCGKASFKNSLEDAKFAKTTINPSFGNQTNSTRNNTTGFYANSFTNSQKENSQNTADTKEEKDYKNALALYEKAQSKPLYNNILSAKRAFQNLASSKYKDAKEYINRCDDLLKRHNKRTIIGSSVCIATVLGIIAITTAVVLSSQTKSIPGEISATQATNTALPLLDVEEYPCTANQIKTVDEMIEEGSYTGQTSDIFYDDNNLYYTFFLGRVSDFVIHSYKTMQYSNDMKSYGQTTFSVEEASESKIKTDYKNQIQDVQKNLSSIELNPKITSSKLKVNPENGQNVESFSNQNMVVYNSGNETSASLNVKLTWFEQVSETSSTFFKDLRTSANKASRSCSFDYDNGTNGLFYSFCSVADVDLFSTLIIDRTTGNYTVQNYSALASSVTSKIMTSARNNFTTCQAMTINDSLFSQLADPERYFDNHPDQSFTNKLENQSVMCGGPYMPELTDTTGNTASCETLKKYGYNAVTFDISFTATGPEDKNAQVSIVNKDSHDDIDYLAFYKWKPGTTVNKVNMTYTCSIDEFISTDDSKRGFYVEFDSKYFLTTIDYKKIVITITIDNLPESQFDQLQVDIT